MKIETGHATLKVNEEGENYWSVWTQDSKDPMSFDPDQPVSFNPNGFDFGTVIRVFENVE